jgi:hypothetical protein
VTTYVSSSSGGGAPFFLTGGLNFGTSDVGDYGDRVEKIEDRLPGQGGLGR